MEFDDIKLYLPKYLSPSAEQNLFDQLKQFPNNLDSRFYSEIVRQEDILYQGDGIEELLITNFPNQEIRKSSAMLISNTCDMSPNNKRVFSGHFCYSPILKISKYREKLLLEHAFSTERIEQFINNIKMQKISQILYLPNNNGLKEEGFIFFDRINSCSLDYLKNEEISGKKLFSLSDYGLYIFLFKLSIHFTRINEGKSRETAN
jgi:hypothetical protein